jgi:uncharacterized protein
MIVPDVNLLVYSYNQHARVHAEAREWWERTLSSPRPVGLAWAVALGFIRIVTNPRVFHHAVDHGVAIRTVRQWLAVPVVQILAPGDEHAETVFGLLEEVGTAGNLTTYAHLAALAIEYQAELATTDADFARFSRLRWFNPLKPRQPARRS